MWTAGILSVAFVNVLNNRNTSAKTVKQVSFFARASSALVTPTPANNGLSELLLPVWHSLGKLHPMLKLVNTPLSCVNYYLVNDTASCGVASPWNSGLSTPRYQTFFFTLQFDGTSRSTWNKLLLAAPCQNTFHSNSFERSIALFSQRSSLREYLDVLRQQWTTEKNNFLPYFFSSCKNFGYLENWMHNNLFFSFNLRLRCQTKVHWEICL